jgi:hypothetical protein
MCCDSSNARLFFFIKMLDCCYSVNNINECRHWPYLDAFFLKKNCYILLSFYLFLSEQNEFNRLSKLLSFWCPCVLAILSTLYFFTLVYREI